MLAGGAGESKWPNWLWAWNQEPDIWYRTVINWGERAFTNVALLGAALKIPSVSDTQLVWI